MSLKERTFASEKGAVFVQVGISIFVMMAFNVFVLDYGMMWVGRRQAQNAADAGALAGATARAYDDFDSSPSPTGVAAQSAEQIVATNLVWQGAATPQVLFDCPAGVTGKCVHVNVYRNGENGSTPLPTLFGPIFGITSQGVRATATAIVANGNATNCLRPIALADNWNEFSPPLTPTSTFMHYSEPGGAVLVNPDTYVAPSATQAGNTLVLDGPRRTANLERHGTTPHCAHHRRARARIGPGRRSGQFLCEPDNLRWTGRRIGADSPGLLGADRFRASRLALPVYESQRGSYCDLERRV